MKEELHRLQDQETKEMEHELEMAKQRQRAIDDLDKGVRGKLKILLLTIHCTEALGFMNIKKGFKA